MEKISWLTRFLTYFFVISVILLGGIFLLVQFVCQDEYSYRNADVIFLTDNARLQLPDGTEHVLEVVDKRFVYEDAKPDEILTVTMEIPDNLSEDMAIGVFSAEQDIEIYIDGVLKESYNNESYRFIRAHSVNHLLMVPLCSRDGGKELTINYTTTLKNYAGILPCPMFGTGANIFLWIFHRYFWQIMSAILLFIIGGIFIIFGLIINYNSNKNVSMCYLGIFSVIVAMWIVCQSDMRIFYSRNLNATDIMASIALMLAPIPKMMFLNELMKYRYQRVYNIVISIALLNAVACLFIAGMGWADLIELQFTSHFVILAAGAVCLGCFFMYAKTQKFVASKAIKLGIAGLVISVIVEYANFFFAQVFYEGKYIGYGILFFLLMLGYATEKSWIVQWQEYRKSIQENEFKNVFLANMSHEIKTPINTILGMNEMITRESTGPAIKGYTDNIYESGQLLLSLVNNILDYTKMESGGMKLMPVRYETGQLFSNLINAVNMKAEEKKLGFDIDVDENIPCVLYGDEIRIRQAILNLLTNAMKYTNEGTVTLRAYADRTHPKEICLHVSVSDTGVGIQKKDQKRLFDSFVRLEENKNRSIEGAGLGMTITRQIMNLMQGEIKMESEYGKGSTFTLIFKQKVVEDAPIGCYEDWYRTSLSTNRYQEVCYVAMNIKILAIDDNEMNLEVIQGLLKNTGAKIDTAFSGEEGIVKAQRVKYDMILLDHMMPGMDGVETLRRLQQIDTIRKNKIPIIALTANAVVGAKEEYLKSGFTDYISKPVDYRTLITTLEKYLPDKVKRCPKIPNKQSFCETYLEEQGIHMKSAMKYAGDEFEQYIHLLELFISKRGTQKELVLQDVYEAENWKDYTTYVHGLKNEARTIGADRLADMAYEHEQRSKEGDIAFLKETYELLCQEWRSTKETISAYLNIYYAGRKEDLEYILSAQELSESEWEETLEQIISCLEGYKKKDALFLLKKLSEHRLAKGKQHNLERAIEAVQGYDYECAIQILKET